jgi:hypothetical protein
MIRCKSRMNSVSPIELTNIRGNRGEQIFFLRITRSIDSLPIFNPAPLGAKWRGTDCYIELLNVPNHRMGFFVQVKTTACNFDEDAPFFPIRLRKEDVNHLLEVPGPTYFAGVHEQTERVFIYSIHSGAAEGITQIPIRFELTPTNLKRLHEEVRGFWICHQRKPLHSFFHVPAPI